MVSKVWVHLASDNTWTKDTSLVSVAVWLSISFATERNLNLPDSSGYLGHLVLKTEVSKSRDKRPSTCYVVNKYFNEGVIVGGVLESRQVPQACFPCNSSDLTGSSMAVCLTFILTYIYIYI